jgi:hypothetical protein
VSLPVGQPNPLFVELGVTEMTDSRLYGLEVVGGIVGANAEQPAGQSVFAGIGRTPEVLLVLATSKNTVQIQFTEVMEDNADLRNAANYVFDGGLATLEVIAVQGSVVMLRTDDQAEGQLYNLTVKGLLAARIRDTIVTSDATATMI